MERNCCLQFDQCSAVAVAQPDRKIWVAEVDVTVAGRALAESSDSVAEGWWPVSFGFARLNQRSLSNLGQVLWALAY